VTLSWGQFGADEEGNVVIGLVLGLICAVICAVVASSKGRSAVGWFFIGLFLGLIGLVLIIVVSNRLQEQETLRQSQEEQRRLREQLLQEKLKSEAFRQHASLRFDAHDKALGMDTRVTPALAEGALAATDAQLTAPPDAPPPAPPAAPAASDLNDGKVWYYELSGAAVGPLSATEIREMLGSGKLTRQSLIWSRTQGEWKPAANIAVFE
jgi:hypothetical protein